MGRKNDVPRTRKNNVKLLWVERQWLLQNIWSEANIECPSRSTRCRIVRETARVKTAEITPPISETHNQKRLEFAEKYEKQDFSEVVLSVSAGQPWMAPRALLEAIYWTIYPPPPIYGVMFRAGVVDNELVAPFRILEGVKKNSENYNCFLPHHHSIDPTGRDQLIFMQDAPPSHASKGTKLLVFQSFFVSQWFFRRQALGLASIIAGHESYRKLLASCDKWIV